MRAFLRIPSITRAVVLSVATLVAPALAAGPATLPRLAPATRPAKHAAQPAQEMTRFLRFVGNARTGGTLETADVTYRNPEGVQIRLVSAVHIAEPEYFESLNQTFTAAGVVLYEMVKPRGAPAPQMGARSDAGVAQLQRFLKETLNLAFQLDVIDYQRPNFVHADLDAETFFELQEQRGESFASILLASLIDALANPQALAAGVDPEEPQTMLDLMTRPDGERQVKLLLARQLGNIEAQAMGLGGLKGTVILTERNKAVMAAVRKELADGKRDITVFYGAAHMPDLGEQLETMGYKPVKTKWRPAWDVRIRPDAPSGFQLLQKRLADVQQQQAH